MVVQVFGRIKTMTWWKSLGFILCGPWMPESIFIRIHHIVVEIFQSESGLPTKTVNHRLVKSSSCSKMLQPHKTSTHGGDFDLMVWFTEVWRKIWLIMKRMCGILLRLLLKLNTECREKSWWHLLHLLCLGSRCPPVRWEVLVVVDLIPLPAAEHEEHVWTLLICSLMVAAGKKTHEDTVVLRLYLKLLAVIKLCV